MTTQPRKLTNSDVGKKFRATTWAPEDYLLVIAISSDGTVFGEWNDKHGGCWNIGDVWLPYTEPQPPKKTVLMAQAIVKRGEGEYWNNLDLFLNREEAEGYCENNDLILIDFPAKDAAGNEIWYQVPIEENNQ